MGVNQLTYIREIITHNRKTLRSVIKKGYVTAFQEGEPSLMISCSLDMAAYCKLDFKLSLE